MERERACWDFLERTPTCLGIYSRVGKSSSVWADLTDIRELEPGRKAHICLLSCLVLPLTPTPTPRGRQAWPGGQKGVAAPSLVIHADPCWTSCQSPGSTHGKQEACFRLAGTTPTSPPPEALLYVSSQLQVTSRTHSIQPTGIQRPRSELPTPTPETQAALWLRIKSMAAP